MQRLTVIFLFLLTGLPVSHAQPFRVLHRGESMLVIDAMRTEQNTADVARYANASLSYPSAVSTGVSPGEMLAAWIRTDSVRSIETARSSDGGKSWLPEPFSADWDGGRFRSLSLFNLGRGRLTLFSGGNPVILSSSHTSGGQWGPFYTANRFGGFRVSSVVPLRGGRLMALFHDDGRFLYHDRQGDAAPLHRSAIYKMYSDDDGLTWSEPQIALKHNLFGLYDAVAVYSPGRRNNELILIASQRGTGTACIARSSDNGQSWSYPEDLPGPVRGDRFGIAVHKHRILLAYRDLGRTLNDGTPNPAFGDIVLWEGDLHELLHGSRHGVKVRIADNYPAQQPVDHEDLKYTDCGYASVLSSARNRVSIIVYGRWEAGALPFIRAFSHDPAQLRRFVRTLDKEN